MSSAEEIIELFGMKPLPREGGFYVETYRCPQKLPGALLAGGSSGQRNLSTAILYLLAGEDFSSLHRIKSDEIYHFYLGDAVTMLRLFPDGRGDVVTLGSDIASGQSVQAAVPGGAWQGCFLREGGRFALMGTTVAPGFEFEDFEQANAELLLAQYPAHREMILRLSARG